MPEITNGYRYVNPEAGLELEVVRPETTRMPGGMVHELAEQYQAVIADALGYQYKGVFGLQAVARTANPDDEQLVTGQADRLATAGIMPPDPMYVHGRIVTEHGGPWQIISVGKAKYADGRSAIARRLHKDPIVAANLADVGDVYVGGSRAALLGLEVRGRGIGSATLHMMLDRYPDDMTTIVYEYPNKNPKILPLLQRLGFSAMGRSRSVEFCGHLIEQMPYLGAPVGELRETLEQRRPWLRERQPVTAIA